MNQRVKVLVLLIVLVTSTTFSAAEPGGNGDGLRDMQCGGACHGDAGQNATSLLTLSIEYPEQVWVGPTCRGSHRPSKALMLLMMKTVDWPFSCCLPPTLMAIRRLEDGWENPLERAKGGFR